MFGHGKINAEGNTIQKTSWSSAVKTEELFIGLLQRGRGNCCDAAFRGQQFTLGGGGAGDEAGWGEGMGLSWLLAQH